MTDVNQPPGGNDMPRFAGPATLVRLPSQPTAAGLDVGFVGVPLDIGTSNRSGTRHGPRQIRAESCMLRPFNLATGARPFASVQVADIGDVAINTFGLKKSIGIIEAAYDEILSHRCKPLTLGGDHTLTLPTLRANLDLLIAAASVMLMAMTMLMIVILEKSIGLNRAIGQGVFR